MTIRAQQQTVTHRRGFLKRIGFGASAAAYKPLVGDEGDRRVALVLDPHDSVASSPACRWAAQQLEDALVAAGLIVSRRDRLSADRFSLLGTGLTPIASQLLQQSRVPTPAGLEDLVLLETRTGAQRTIMACGPDARGLSYALNEITDRLRNAGSLEFPQPIHETPANQVRSVMRQFTSELLDKPWFYDRDQWTHYLDLLAAQRWNRFDLAFGLGYDQLKQVDDSYFLFFYPFVLDVPGYNVRATGVPDTERDRNLETLRFIGEQTVARGIDFQLGIWMHGYQWPNGRAQNKIEGLTQETHAPYCRDALSLLLRKCPAISSVGLRIHGESGVAEGSYQFWSAVFDGVKQCGRTVEIDLHAKGIDEKMIGNALATGMPVNVSPKYSAEHFGMPYHQAAIREIEMPVAGHVGSGLMSLSEGSRVFTRYGYADLLREDRRYTVRHRIFSGTQRILLWGDPVSTAAYARSFQFCGSTGADLMEPLTCRGRRGSAVPGFRSGYSDASLQPRWDWEKYAGWYRVWGRLMYNPQTSADVYTRGFTQIGSSGQPLRSAVASASRILPAVTTAYLPSAACDAYWPEIYWNQPMGSEPRKNPYTDTLAPKVFQNASPLDPQLFLSMREFAQELITTQKSGKYSPSEVAAWLEQWATQAEAGVRTVGELKSANARRIAIDVRMQATLGRFFAAKFRAGVLYAIYEQTGARSALEAALQQYRAAQKSWAHGTDIAQAVYADDLSCSDRFDERGQWRDRMAGIAADIADVQQRLDSTDSADTKASRAIQDVLTPPNRRTPACRHMLPPPFHRNAAVEINLVISPSANLSDVQLLYRHVNQSEHFQILSMRPGPQSGAYTGEIPAAYADSPYPLQYYFVLRTSANDATLFPGFAPDPINQPYFVLRQDSR